MEKKHLKKSAAQIGGASPPVEPPSQLDDGDSTASSTASLSNAVMPLEPGGAPLSAKADGGPSESSLSTLGNLLAQATKARAEAEGATLQGALKNKISSWGEVKKWSSPHQAPRDNDRPETLRWMAQVRRQHAPAKGGSRRRDGRKGRPGGRGGVRSRRQGAAPSGASRDPQSPRGPTKEAASPQPSNGTSTAAAAAAAAAAAKSQHVHQQQGPSASDPSPSSSSPDDEATAADQPTTIAAGTPGAADVDSENKGRAPEEMKPPSVSSEAALGSLLSAATQARAAAEGAALQNALRDEITSWGDLKRAGPPQQVQRGPVTQEPLRFVAPVKPQGHPEAKEKTAQDPGKKNRAKSPKGSQKGTQRMRRFGWSSENDLGHDEAASSSSSNNSSSSSSNSSSQAALQRMLASTAKSLGLDFQLGQEEGAPEQPTTSKTSPRAQQEAANKGPPTDTGASLRGGRRPQGVSPSTTASESEGLQIKEEAPIADAVDGLKDSIAPGPIELLQLLEESASSLGLESGEPTSAASGQERGSDAVHETKETEALSEGPPSAEAPTGPSLASPLSARDTLDGLIADAIKARGAELIKKHANIREATDAAARATEAAASAASAAAAAAAAAAVAARKAKEAVAEARAAALAATGFVLNSSPEH
ncbi:hypothetical protein Emag_001349 [Eimeria magna]